MKVVQAVFARLCFFDPVSARLLVFGFAKSDQNNISAADLKDFHNAATLILGYTEAQIALAVETENLFEGGCWRALVEVEGVVMMWGEASYFSPIFL